MTRKRERVIKSFLPIIDILEMSMININNNDKIRESLFITLKLTRIILKENNVKVIKPKRNETFNPKIHQAILSLKINKSKNKILNVLQKGYILKKRLLRPALVSIRI